LSSEETETVIHSDDAFATVAYLRLKRLIVKEKQAIEIISNPNIVAPSWEDDVKDMMVSIEKLVDKLLFIRFIFLTILSSE
jgi:diphthine-ammonia ligase